MASSDPRDEGRPGLKEWEEFRASYAAARIHEWLLRDIEELIPDYPNFLHNRLMTAFDIAEGSDIDFITLPGPGLEEPDYGSWEWWETDDFEDLYKQLFPHGSEDTDFSVMARGLVAVALHSALENFLKASSAEQIRNLPDAVVGYLEGFQSELDAKTYLLLTELDATRHVYVHNRGVDDERYVENVAKCRFRPDERRVVTRNELALFADTVWKISRAIQATRQKSQE